MKSRKAWGSGGCGTLLLLLLCSAAMSWEIEVVEDGKKFDTMSDRSLRLDSQGNPHVAYGEDHLYYSCYDGAEWHHEIADSVRGVGGHAALALDSNGFAHVSYYDATNMDLKYAYYDGISWQTEAVDTAGDVGQYTSIELDDSDIPHISYYDLCGALRYAYFDSIEWQITVVDTVGDTGKYSSIAIGENGQVHISYYDQTNRELRYAKTTALSWCVEIVAEGWSLYNSIALDGNGQPHIAYSGHYAYKNENGWHLEDLPRNSWQNYLQTSLSLDSNDSPHISSKVMYGDYPAYEMVYYAYKDSSGWQSETVDSHSSIYADLFGRWNSIVLDREDIPYITYLAETDTRWDLTLGVRDSGSWGEINLATSTIPGKYNALAIMNSSTPCVSFCERYDLKFAYRVGSSWSTEIVYSSPNQREPFGCSLQLGVTGIPHISFREMGSGGSPLMYAHRQNESWVVDMVGSEYQSGFGQTSLALDYEEEVHIALNCDYQGLKYAYSNGEAWVVEVVDEHGKSPSLKMDSIRHCHLVYGKSLSGIGYAVKKEMGWEYETISDASGTYVSLILDSQDQPHISFTNESILCYAHRDQSVWIIDTVDNTGEVGRSSIAVDVYGNPHISYYDEENALLKYTYKNASGWHTQAIDDAGGFGPYTSLSIDAQGIAHISYYDGISRDLRYAVGPALPTIQVVGELTEGAFVLNWSALPATEEYWVYGASNLPHFNPGFAPDYFNRLFVLPSEVTTWSSSAGTGDPANNWTYQIIAVNDQYLELARSNRIGEWDWGMGIR